LLADKLANAGWSGTLVLDAGDALSPMNTIMEGQRARVVATAELLVAQFAAQRMDVMAVGDRDLALGAETLRRLTVESKVPFVATNLVDAQGAPVFRRSVLVERAGVRALVLGLVGVSGQRMAASSLAPEGWRFMPIIDAAKAAIAEAGKVDLVIVLSQLSPAEEGELAKAIPEVRLLLGGDAMGMSPDVNPIGAAVALAGAQKGKHVGVATITLSDPRGPSAPLVDPGAKGAIEARKASAARRVESLERVIEQARQAPTTPAPEGAPGRPQRKTPIEAYERQLAAARADLQLAEQDLAEIDARPAEQGNLIEFELVPMDPAIADEPKTKSAVDKFRTVWPDPTKAPHPPPPAGVEP